MQDSDALASVAVDWVVRGQNFHAAALREWFAALRAVTILQIAKTADNKATYAYPNVRIKKSKLNASLNQSDHEILRTSNTARRATNTNQNSRKMIGAATASIRTAFTDSSRPMSHHISTANGTYGIAMMKKPPVRMSA